MFIVLHNGYVFGGLSDFGDLPFEIQLGDRSDIGFFRVVNDFRMNLNHQETKHD